MHDSYSKLSTALGRFRRRAIAIGFVAGLALALSASLGFVMLCAWLDLVFELPPNLRIVALALATAAFTFLVMTSARTVRARSHLARVARILDARGQTGGEIACGVDLDGESNTAHPVSTGLARLAVCRAAETAARVPPHEAISIRSIFWPGAVLLGLQATVLLALFVNARLVATQWFRFTDPFGDHPPYSRNEFHVTPGDTSVAYNDGFDIFVAVSGPPIDLVDLILLDARRREVSRIPMFPEAPMRWRATLTSLTESGHYFVATPRARSRRHAIEIKTVPRLGEVRYRLTPPVYAHQNPSEGPVPSQGLAGLRGSRIELFAQSNRPLSRGELRLRTSQGDVTHILSRTPKQTEVEGEFKLEHPGTFTLTVVDDDGQESADQLRATLTLLVDHQPFVRIVQPPSTSLASPSASIPVTVSAEDDYGISRVRLYRDLNGSRPLPVDFALVGNPETNWQGSEVLPLHALGVMPGDIIRLFARVEDTDPEGPKGSESSVVTIQIISEDELQRLALARAGLELMASKYEAARRRQSDLTKELDRLIEKLDQSEPNQPIGEAEKRALQDLIQRLRKDAEATRDASKAELPVDLDRELSKELAKWADALEAAAREAQDVLSESKDQIGKMSAALQGIKGQLSQANKKLSEEALEPLEHLSKVYPLIEDQARFVALYERQRSLSVRLAALAGIQGADDPTAKRRMRELQQEQAKVRIQLEQLLGDIESHAAQLPDTQELKALGKTAAEFAAAVRGSNANSSMVATEQGLSAFDGSIGYASALAAADTLESFLSRCQSGQKEGRVCLKFQPKLNSCLGNSVDQLLASAGLGMGMGLGAGTGNGYSASRNSLQNIGLFGALPTFASGGTRGGRSLAGNGAGPRDGAAGKPQAWESKNQVETSHGSYSEIAIPLKYRQRVGEYLRRIADDAADK